MATSFRGHAQATTKVKQPHQQPLLFEQNSIQKQHEPPKMYKPHMKFRPGEGHPTPKQRRGQRSHGMIDGHMAAIRYSHTRASGRIQVGQTPLHPYCHKLQPKSFNSNKTLRLCQGRKDTVSRSSISSNNSNELNRRMDASSVKHTHREEAG